MLVPVTLKMKTDFTPQTIEEKCCGGKILGRVKSAPPFGRLGSGFGAGPRYGLALSVHKHDFFVIKADYQFGK
jgi:hypothetical protein